VRFYTADSPRIKATLLARCAYVVSFLNAEIAEEEEREPREV
jgi:hypothetical protein